MKAAAIKATLASYGDEDLATACRLLTASPFAGTDSRTLSIGPSTALGALQVLCSTLGGVSLRQKLVGEGYLAALAARVLPDRAPALTLAAAASAFADMASADMKPKERQRAIVNLLAQASPAEAYLLISVATGELRLGLALNALLDPLAKAFDVLLGGAQRLQMLLGDVGKTAVRLRPGALEVALVPFKPLALMLAKPYDTQDPAALAPNWPLLGQDKYDGIRLHIHIGSEPAAEGSHVRGLSVKGLGGRPVRLALLTRTGDDVTESFPVLHRSLVAALGEAATGGGAIVGGELLAIQGDTVLPFRDLYSLDRLR